MDARSYTGVTGPQDRQRCWARRLAEAKWRSTSSVATWNGTSGECARNIELPPPSPVLTELVHQAPLFTSVTSPDGTSALLHLEVVGQSAGASAPRPSGTAWIDASSRKLHIACGEHGSSVVVIDRVKPAGGKWIHAWDWWNGQGRLVRYSDGTVKLE